MTRAIPDIIRQIYFLVRPYGRTRLLLVSIASTVQAFLQALSVASVVPFLAMAADPERFLESSFGMMVSSVWPNSNQESLLLTGGIASIALLIIANATSFLADCQHAKYVHEYAHWLRMRLVSHIVDQPYSYFFQRNTSVLTKKVVNDVNQFASRLLSPMLDASTRAATTLCLLATLLAFEPVVAMISIVVLTIYYASIFRVLRHRRVMISADLKRATRGEFFVITQLLGAIKIVMARNCARTLVDQYSRFSLARARASALIPIYSNSPKYLLEPLAYGGLVVWILIAIVSGQNFMTVLPTISLVAMTAYRLIPSVQALYSQTNQLLSSRHSLEEILEEVRDIKWHAPSRALREGNLTPRQWTDSLKLVDVSYTYPGTSKPAISGVDLVIPKGNSIGLVGSTGSGKSTLADIILGLLPPDKGAMLLDGAQLRAEDMPSWRAGIGYVPQDIVLLDATLSENIAFGVPADEIDHAKVRKSAQIAQISRFIEQEVPDQYETMVGERGVRISGGQRQRIGLARALYHEPQVLILDEATSALDNETEGHLMNSIRSLPKDLTVIMIAHRLTTVQSCDKLIFIESGEIRAEGSFSDLIENDQRFQQLALKTAPTNEAA